MAEALPDITTRILEAELKLHQLLTGTNMVSISYEGRTVQYRAYVSDIENLRAYINQMKTEAGLLHPRRPLGMVW